MPQCFAATQHIILCSFIPAQDVDTKCALYSTHETHVFLEQLRQHTHDYSGVQVPAEKCQIQAETTRSAHMNTPLIVHFITTHLPRVTSFHVLVVCGRWPLCAGLSCASLVNLLKLHLVTTGRHAILSGSAVLIPGFGRLRVCRVCELCHQVYLWCSDYWRPFLSRRSDGCVPVMFDLPRLTLCLF